MNEINKIERNVLDAYFSTRVNNAPPPHKVIFLSLTTRQHLKSSRR